MTKILAIPFLFFQFILFSQDTLSCKKDLVWHKQEKFYYRKDDPNRRKYSGPVKCYPGKGIENRGTLKNGSWDGIVYGFKLNKLIGYAQFKEGTINGFKVKFFEDGRLNDSVIIQNAYEIFSKKWNYTKNKELKTININSKNSDSTYKLIETYENGLKINYTSFNLNLKSQNLIIKKYYLEFDENEKPNYTIFEYKKFVNTNKLEFQRFYDSGIPYRDDYFENGKKVKEIIYFGDLNKTEAIILYKNGKLHGESKHFDVDGQLIRLENYKKGKLVNVVDELK
jgi:antitoxin component YwqK of YwqJK toxin-antitoxin module